MALSVDNGRCFLDVLRHGAPSAVPLVSAAPPYLGIPKKSATSCHLKNAGDISPIRSFVIAPVSHKTKHAGCIEEN
jgi:hypothetical protein